MEFIDDATSITLAVPFRGADPDFSPQMDAMTEWTDLHCEGPYIIMLTTVVFKLESDAIIFKLKYG